MKFYIFASREHEPDFVSSNVMKKINADYSHCGIIVEYVNHSLIYDATGKGVTEHPLEDFLSDHALIFKIDITHLIISEQYATGWLDGSLGKGYSKKQYVGFMAQWLKPFVRDDKREMVCSELAGRFVDECTILTCFAKADFDFLDPKMMIEELQKELAEVYKLPEGIKK